VASLITTCYSSTRESARIEDVGEQMAENRRDREMSRICFPAALFSACLLALRRRRGRSRVAAPRRSITWGAGRRPFVPGTSSRLRAIGPRRSVCAGSPDLEAQALARRGETYRIEGYFRDASSDLQAALAKAEQSRDLQGGEGGGHRVAMGLLLPALGWPSVFALGGIVPDESHFDFFSLTLARACA
jgi:hypothetical protein